MFGNFGRKVTSKEKKRSVRINYDLSVFSEFESSWNGDRLQLQSFDHSDEIVKGFGCCVDYDLIFDKENADKLFRAVNKKTDDIPGGCFRSLNFTDLKEFCDKRGIKYTYNSWYDFD